MNNIFENAKFGDKFIDLDGKILIFLSLIRMDELSRAYMACEDGNSFGYDIYLVMPDFIASKYVEPINEEELNKSAEDFCDTIDFEPTQLNESQTGMECGYTYMHLIKCYKEGYHKVKEK